MVDPGDIWTSRVGPAAAAALTRRLRFSRLGGVVGLLTVIAGSVSILLASPTGETVSMFGGVGGMVVFFAVATHDLVRAQQEAVAYLGLAPALRKWVPVRDPARFDRWVTTHGNSSWSATRGRR